MTKPVETCGILHSLGSYCWPQDADGCVLAMSHEGPHEFVDERGERWQWESDLSCTECHPDECDCTIYWRKQYSAA